MARKANQKGLRFKPHMKTHQSAEIGHWLKDAGANAVTVSSVKMAQYFADAGWSDITIAFPVNLREYKTIDELAGRIELTLLVNNPVSARALGEKLSNVVKAYIEIDTGSNRSGIPSGDVETIDSLIKDLKNTSKINWVGFYSHPGHSYQCSSKKEIHKVHNSVREQFFKLRQDFESLSSEFEICVGDTPCCSVGENYEGLDAMSPGNFVFYDLMQVQIGSCSVSDIAVAVECPIVDRYPDRQEMIIHGGAVHFSKEMQHSQHGNHYGLAAVKSESNSGWRLLEPTAQLRALSQEHGVLRAEKETINKCRVGDSITILPVHSCLTANLMEQYKLSDERTISQMPV